MHKIFRHVGRGVAFVKRDHCSIDMNIKSLVLAQVKDGSLF